MPLTVTLRTTSSVSLDAWDPVAVRREVVRNIDGRCELSLPALGSVFLVPGGTGEAPWHVPDNEVPLDGPWELTLPGAGEFALLDGPRSWTELSADGRAFAGVGTYRTEVVVDAAPRRRTVLLTAADVGDLARARVNGGDCGVVWTDPYRIDVTRALRPGRNTIEIDVANAWMNRLIAEAAESTGELFESVTGVYAPDAPVRASGLTGPVVLQIFG